MIIKLTFILKFALKFKGEEEETFCLIEGIIEKTEDQSIINNNNNNNNYANNIYTNIEMNNATHSNSIEKHTAALDSWSSPLSFFILFILNYYLLNY